MDWLHGILVFFVATAAILVFTAATQKYFFDKCSALEVILLLLIAFTLFRPAYFMEKISPSYVSIEPYNIVSELQHVKSDRDMKIRVSGLSDIGEPTTFYAHLPILGETGEQRLENMGLTLVDNDGVMMIDDVSFDSPGAKMGLDWDQTILSVELPVEGSLAKQWLYIPALLLLLAIALIQIRRRKKELVKLAMD